MSARAPTVRREPTEEIGRLHRALSHLGHLVTTLVLALLLSILLEWIGMNVWWPEQAVRHSERMLAAELGYLNDDFSETVLGTSPAALARSSAEATRRSIRALGSQVGASLPLARSFATSTYLAAAANVVETFAVRLVMLALSMPVFALFGLVGFAEGLMRRDLRRWGGGRESSFVYHRAKGLLAPSILSAWMLYLASPFTVHPTLILLPFATAFGIGIAVTTGTFKKYL